MSHSCQQVSRGENPPSPLQDWFALSILVAGQKTKKPKNRRSGVVFCFFELQSLVGRTLVQLQKLQKPVDKNGS